MIVYGLDLIHFSQQIMIDIFMNEKDSFFLMKKLLFLCREFCFFRKTYNFNMGVFKLFFYKNFMGEDNIDKLCLLPQW